MKKLFLFASALILSVGVFAQSAQAKKAEDVLKFKELSYDFGKIKQNSPVTHDFVFTNTSASPVIIESTIASCGCTTPNKPEGAIQKGKDDKITVAYNAAAMGPFTKTITVKVAGIDMPLQLRISGEVVSVADYTKSKAGR